MITKSDRNRLRSDLFRHLDGLVVAPAAAILDKKGITHYILEKQIVDLKEVSKKFGANEGYLNVALHTFASQGWLKQHIDNQEDKVTLEINENSAEAFSLFHLYQESFSYIKNATGFSSRQLVAGNLTELKSLFENFKTEFSDNEISENSIRFQIQKHIEGVLLAPLLVHLGMNGMFHKYFMETRFKTEEFHKDAENYERILDILTFLGLFNKTKGFFEFTDKGLFFARRASSYGVTVSYLPTIRNLEELIFGNPLVLQSKSGEEEQHVDREMNVWGSGGAHTAYFKILDEIIKEIFNRPIDQQPKGILDMGCGNGAFLQHLFNLIEQQTLRGKMLEDYPLILIGADYNRTALKVTKANLIQAEIWAKIVWGDIGEPDRLASDLREDYGIELEDVLNVRSFLDHNRLWNEPSNPDSGRISESTGAFCKHGRRIPNNHVEESLKEHFEKWAPYLKKYGLLTIELHTVDPEIIASNPGKSAVTAYDATHGYSDQYILEAEIFREILKETGLTASENHSILFPNDEIATVSVNFFESSKTT